MHGNVLRVIAPGRIELQPFRVDTPLPADHIEGPAVVSAVSPGTELGWAFTSQVPGRLPAEVGYAMVFRVERAGQASGFAVGDLAFATANHASYVRCAGASAWHVPAGMAPADAALSRLAGVSWSTLITTAARPPAQVAVTGLGIVGNLAAQIFHAAGYRVLACDPVAARRELLAGRGIELRDRLPVDDPVWADTELVVDCSGHEAAALDACKLVRKGGEVVLVGVPWARRSELSAFDLLHAVFHRYVHLRSGWEWEVPRNPSEFRCGSIQANIAGAMAWFADGRLSSTGIIRHADPRDCQEVYQELQAQRGPHLTVAFDWSLLEKAP